MKPTVIIGCDHGGFKMKQAVLTALAKANYTVIDLGGFSDHGDGTAKGDDYPDYAKAVGTAVASDKKTRGILICGSGTGMSMAANKIRGIRAAMIYDTYSAKMARHDNDANIACLRGRGVPQKTIVNVALTFLRAPFSGIDRHKKRIQKVMRLDT